MIFGTLGDRGEIGSLWRHPIWSEAFAWIGRRPADQPTGIYELRGRQMFANVHGYETKPRAMCRYESHRLYVDLQIGLNGGECIEWHPLDALMAKDEYDVEKDVIHYHAPECPGGTFRLSRGNFAVFFPEDGHMPKIEDRENTRIEKLVIKIHRSLLI